MVMGTTPGERLLCSGCFYELRAMREDEGVCPECGLGYRKPLMRARRRAVVSVGLTMVAWGMVGAVLLDMGLSSAVAAGESTPMVRFSAVLSFNAAAVLAACGVVLLARASAHSRWMCRWPAVIAAAYLLAALLNMDYWRVFNGRWPIGWLGGTWILWILQRANAVGTWLLIGTAMLVVARMVREVGGPGCRWFARTVGVLVLLGLAAQWVRWGYEGDDYTGMPGIWLRPRLAPGRVVPPGFSNQQATVDALDIALGTLRGLAMVAVGVAAVVVRALWRAEGAGRVGAG